VCGDRCEVRALSMVIQALEFEPVGPQNQWVDMMFLTVHFFSFTLLIGYQTIMVCYFCVLAFVYTTDLLSYL
jgi:hypothetical protein